MQYFDTHAHYSDKAFDSDRNQMLEKCKQNNIKYIIDVGDNTSSSVHCVRLASEYNFVYAAIGIHPSEIHQSNVEEILNIYSKNNGKKIVAIGEIGLDYSVEKEDSDYQKEIFIQQIELANYLKLPILIHTRAASLDTYNLLLNEKKPEYGAILHCFNPTEDLVRLVLKRNYTVAFGGNITYPRKKSFAQYINQIPISNIVLETDCPYLAPIPYKGTRNSSLNLPIICEKLAEYLNMDVNEINEITFRNAIKFFKLV